MLKASLENLKSRPWTSIPTLKARSRSSPEGRCGSDSARASSAGSTAPEGWVAGCHVSSKSIECTLTAWHHDEPPAFCFTYTFRHVLSTVYPPPLFFNAYRYTVDKCSKIRRKIQAWFTPNGAPVLRCKWLESDKNTNKTVFRVLV